MALRSDSMKVLHALFRRGSISEAEQKRLDLKCDPDTLAFLIGSGFVLKAKEAGAPWTLNPVLNAFITELEGNFDQFPPRDFLFQFPMLERYPDPAEIFIAMPYGPVWFEKVKGAIERASRAAGYTPTIGNNIQATGFIMDQVWLAMRRAAAVVADISERNPNVMYEAGMAHALGRSVVFLIQPGTAQPFDIAANRLIYYSQDDLPKLEAELSGTLRGLPKNPLADVVELEP